MLPHSRNVRLIAIGVAALVIAALATGTVWVATSWLNSRGVAAGPTATATPSPSASAGPNGSTIGAGQQLTCPTQTTSVSSTAGLVKALASARAGEVIKLAGGVYSGNFVAKAVATAAQPIWLCGGPDAILDGKDSTKGYVMHLDGASHWYLVGFTVRNGQKGVVIDRSSFNTISNLTVTGIGDEAIHLRSASTDNTVASNTISHTGLLKAKFGEGIYVGTARKNWCNISNCQPDRSDRNTIIGNRISNTTAENVDIKEGTTGGRLLNNSFDGVGMVDAGATAWVNVKGNHWLIDGNTGTDSIGDGFQTHQILAGWGTDNTFTNNTATVNGPGFGFHLTPALSNLVRCTNSVMGAARGSSNVPCSSS